MSTANVLIEELGPRGKRRVRVATAIAPGIAALAGYWMYLQLRDSGQPGAARVAWPLYHT